MAEYICPRCDHIGKPKLKKRGSGRIEFMGWLIFPFGLPYTLWRMVGKFPTCSQCGSEELIDRYSAIGRKLVPPLEDLYPEELPEKPVAKKDDAAEFFPSQKPDGTPNPNKLAADPEVW